MNSMLCARGGVVEATPSVEKPMKLNVDVAVAPLYIGSTELKALTECAPAERARAMS